MIETLQDLRAALKSRNVQAFLRAVRLGESDPDTDQAYHALYGWTVKTNTPRFDDLADHPRVAIKSGYGWTSSAGAYQAMAAVPGKVKTDTWGDWVKWCAEQRWRPSMSYADQDLFAVWCIARRHALVLVLHGRFERAIELCAYEWASLPGSPYGQPTRTMDELRAVYLRYDGVIDAMAPDEPSQKEQRGSDSVAESHAPAPSEPGDGGVAPTPNGPAPAPERSKPMLPILAGLAGEAVISLAKSIWAGFAPLAQDKLEKEINRHTDRPEVARQVAAAVVGAAMSVTGKTDPIEATVAARTDPQVIAQVQQVSLDELAKLAPLLQQLDEMDRRRLVDEDASRDAASRRAATDPNDQDQYLTRAIVRLMIGMLALSSVLALGFAWLKMENALTAVLTLITAGAGIVYGKFGTRFDHRYGGSRGSEVKTVLMDQMSRGRAQQ